MDAAGTIDLSRGIELAGSATATGTKCDGMGNAKQRQRMDRSMGSHTAQDPS